jgi:hypothetical protein
MQPEERARIRSFKKCIFTPIGNYAKRTKYFEVVILKLIEWFVEW